MGGDKDAYCEFHKLYGHTTEKSYKLKDWLVETFVDGELEGIHIDYEPGSEKKEKAHEKRDQSDEELAPKKEKDKRDHLRIQVLRGIK